MAPTITASLHNSAVAQRCPASGTKSSAWVFTQLASLSAPLKQAPTFTDPTVQSRCKPTLQALFFQVAQELRPIRASILFTSDRFPLPVFRSKMNLIERQIQNRAVIGCRSSDAEEMKHAGSAFSCWISVLLLDQRSPAGSAFSC